MDSPNSTRSENEGLVRILSEGLESAESQERLQKLGQAYLRDHLRQAAFCYNILPKPPPLTRWQQTKASIRSAWATFVKRYICPCHHDEENDDD